MFFKNRPTPASFIVYFRSFQTNIIIIFQQIYVKIRPSSIRDSKPQPLEHEPPPITTRPGLPLGLIWKGLHRSRASSRGDFFLCCPATKDKSQQGGGDRGFDLFTLFVYFTQLLPTGWAFFG